MRALLFFISMFCLMILNQNGISQVIKINPKKKNSLKYLNADNNKALNAAIYLEKENRNYFFRKGQYLRLLGNKIEEGYPTKIHNGWKDLPQYWRTGIDAAIRCEPTKETIFFKGREYFTIQNGYPVSKIPKKLPGEFMNLPRFFHSNIDAGVYLPNIARLYLFKGNQYVRIKLNKVEQGYPKKLPGEWKNLPTEFCSGIEAALHRSGTTYFFKNGKYVKYSNQKVETGFQKELEAG